MATESLHKTMKSLLAQADAVLTVAGDKPLSQEESTKYLDLVKQAEATKTAIEAAERLDGIKNWASSSAGSAVSTTFNQAVPGAGEIPGVTQDKNDPNNGELFALNQMGEDTLKIYKSGAYKDAFVGYLRAKARGDPLSSKHANILSQVKSGAMKVLQEAVDTSGGAWLPPDFRAEVIKKIVTITSIRRNAQVYTTGTDMITFPAVTWTTNDLYTTGATLTWQGSVALAAATAESTNPVAGQIKIPVNEAVCKFLMTRSQMEDNSFDMLGYLGEVLAETYAVGEESAFTNGTGATQPAGFLTNTNLIANHIHSGVSAHIRWEGIVGSEDPTLGLLGVEAALPPQYEGGAKWYANKASYGAIRGLADSNHRPLWQQTDGQFGNWALGYPVTLLGYPIEKDQFIPSEAADSYPVVLGDMKVYYIVDRVGLSVEVFRETYADWGQVLIYGRKRLGGQLVKDWMLKALVLTA